MNNLYVIHAAESIISIVKAHSKEAAFDIFVLHQTEDENLNYFITSFAPNDGLLEWFYKDDTGHFLDGYDNGGPHWLQQLNKQEKEDYMDAWIKKNVNQFWSDEPQFASEYLQALNKGYHLTEIYKPEFSHGFWVNTIKKLFQQGNWYEDFEITKINLTDHDYQLIYTN